MGSYAYKPFDYVTPPELRGEPPRRRPVVVVGAGPVGLCAAIDLAIRGVPVVVVDDNNVVSIGSRAICWSKRTLEIFDRLGVGDRMLAKGVTWHLGRIYHRDQELYSFDLQPEGGHKMPAFINLQQYYVEEYLVDRARDFPDLIELRWNNEVTGLRQTPDGVVLDIKTPDGTYSLEADWVFAADGARSPIRHMLGLGFPGHVFEERFLIADVRMHADFPSERLFWFEPTFHAGQSALLHRQPDDVFRIDFQLGPDADQELEKQPERVIPRIKAVVGENTPFELEWCSVYVFRCARLERFVHGRVLFVGDSAHVVSPFGARGGNGGIQDVDNLVWKLALVLNGEAPASLIATYDAERGRGADENILNSSRTTNFMTPKNGAERLFRDGVLALAPDFPFARSLVNGGRLSRPCSLDGLPLQSDDAFEGADAARPGAPCPDAPLVDAAGEDTWLLDHLGGPFTVLAFASAAGDAPSAAAVAALRPQANLCIVADAPLEVEGATVLVDRQGLARARYGGEPGTTYLIRPDAHVAARFARFEPAAVAGALARASGNDLQTPASEAA